MEQIDATDIAACFVAIINGLVESGVPRETLVRSFQERLLTLDGTVQSDLVLLNRLARMTDADGAD